MDIDIEKVNTYEKFLEQEGLPVIRDYSVPDLMAAPLRPWARKGGLGAYINLIGAEGTTDAYICEIPPGKSLLPQRHLYEELIYILSGSGATTVWVEDSKKQSFEWQEGSLFAPPLNTWHQHFNGQTNDPVRYVAVTRAPVFINLVHNLNFIFNNNYVFEDRYIGEEDFFSSQGKSFEDKFYGDINTWECNFIPDCRKFKLEKETEGGMGEISFAFFEMSNNILSVHIGEEPVGTYKKAHYHGPGAHLLCLAGQGYDLWWPAEGGIMAEGVERIKIDWQKNTIISPPDRWFHQHFVTSKDPSLMVAFHAERSHKYAGVRKDYGSSGKDGVYIDLARLSTKRGGTQIDYEDEDPAIRQLFKEELAKTGAPYRMSKYFPGE